MKKIIVTITMIAFLATAYSQDAKAFDPKHFFQKSYLDGNLIQFFD